MMIIVMGEHVCVPIATVSFLMGLEGRGRFLPQSSPFRGDSGSLHIKIAQ